MKYTHNGYGITRKKDHKFTHSNGYVFDHRLIWEKHHKCCLLPFAVIHHKNGDRKDNSVENLEAMSRSQHAKLHRKNPNDIIDPDDDNKTILIREIKPFGSGGAYITLPAKFIGRKIIVKL